MAKRETFFVNIYFRALNIFLCCIVYNVYFKHGIFSVKIVVYHCAHIVEIRACRITDAAVYGRLIETTRVYTVYNCFFFFKTSQSKFAFVFFVTIAPVFVEVGKR